MKAHCPNVKKIPLSSLFYALSDPVRVEIILLLLKEKEFSCGQYPTSLSKSTMSHHFRVLREAGLINKREEGKVHYISLRTTELEERLPGFIAMLEHAKKPW